MIGASFDKPLAKINYVFERITLVSFGDRENEISDWFDVVCVLFAWPEQGEKYDSEKLSSFWRTLNKFWLNLASL